MTQQLANTPMGQTIVVMSRCRDQAIASDPRLAVGTECRDKLPDTYSLSINVRSGLACIVSAWLLLGAARKLHSSCWFILGLSVYYQWMDATERINNGVEVLDSLRLDVSDARFSQVAQQSIDEHLRAALDFLAAEDTQLGRALPDQLTLGSDCATQGASHWLPPSEGGSSLWVPQGHP